MLSKFRVQRYKSLYDTEVTLEPLTVFIGPNGSGKSNICEALFVWARFIENIEHNISPNIYDCFLKAINFIPNNPQNLKSKFWQGDLKSLSFQAEIDFDTKKSFNLINLFFDYNIKDILIGFQKGGQPTQERMAKNSDSSYFQKYLSNNKFLNSQLHLSFNKIEIYDFLPFNLSGNTQYSNQKMDRTGQGISASLARILLGNRKLFNELEERLTSLVPNISRIHLDYNVNGIFKLELIDRYSDHLIPVSDISDGTLRILAFLAVLYQEKTPSIICFEEIENGVHPWLLHKMMELLKIVSTEGINGKPVQILLTTHSPLILNYVEPHQVRAVELDNEGKTQVHALPTDSVRFQKSLEAYDGELGELWFTNVFGGNPA